MGQRREQRPIVVDAFFSLGLTQECSMSVQLSGRAAVVPGGAASGEEGGLLLLDGAHHWP